MEPILSVIAGVVIWLLTVGMFFVLWDYTDGFGKFLATLGGLGMVAAMCYYGVTIYNDIFFGYVAATVLALVIVIPINCVRAIRWFGNKLLTPRKHCANTIEKKEVINA